GPAPGRRPGAEPAKGNARSVSRGRQLSCGGYCPLAVLALSSASYRWNWAKLLVNLVRPVLGSTVTKYIQDPCAGCSAALMAASPGLSIGPGGRPVCRKVL